MHKANLSPTLKSWGRPPAARVSDVLPTHSKSKAKAKTKVKPQIASSSSSSRPHLTSTNNHHAINNQHTNNQHVNTQLPHRPAPRLPITPPRQNVIPGSDPACAIDLTVSPSPQRPQRPRLPLFDPRPHPQFLSHANAGPLTRRPLRPPLTRTRTIPIRDGSVPEVPYGRPGRPRPPNLQNSEASTSTTPVVEDVQLVSGSGKVDKRSSEWKRLQKEAMLHSPQKPQYAQQEDRKDAGDGRGSDMRLSRLLAALSASSASTSNTLSAPAEAAPNLNAAFITALASIDSGYAGEEGVNPALVTALRALLGSAPSTKSTANETTRPRTRSSGAVPSEEGDDGDDDGDDDPDYMDDDEEDGEDDPAPAAQEDAGEKENISPRKNNAKDDEGKGRKRRLSDFMEQKDREREEERARSMKRKPFGGAANANDTRSEGAVESAARSRGLSYDPFGTHARTSPTPETRIAVAAPATSLNPCPSALAFSTTALGPGLGLGFSFSRTMSLGSTASLSTAEASQDENVSACEGGETKPRANKKKYIVPAWARTDTTTKPRLSEAAIQAQRERAEEAEAEQRKRHKGHTIKGASTKKRIKENRRSNAESTQRREEKRTSSPLGLPVCASSDMTIVAPSSPPRGPQTPPPRTRRKHTLTPLTRSVGGGSGLFTPSPRKGSGGGQGLFGTPLYSPCAARVSAKVFSPMKGGVLPKDEDVFTARTEDDEDERLARELDSELESDAPSSSLPVASSDSEAEPPATSSSGSHLNVTTKQDTQGDVEEDGDTTMRFWTAGLPPSSPPPPSSPLLLPQDDDAFGADWMSDSDGLAFEYDSDAPMDMAEPLGNFDGSASDGPTMSMEEFNQLFSDPVEAVNVEADIASTQSADFDFAQFWETVKPLIDSQSAAGGYHDETQVTDAGVEVDHVKLAEDVYALFSGCLM